MRKGFGWSLTSAHFLTPVCSSSLEVQGSSQLLHPCSLREGYTHSLFRCDAAVQADAVLFTPETRSHTENVRLISGFHLGRSMSNCWVFIWIHMNDGDVIFISVQARHEQQKAAR